MEDEKRERKSYEESLKVRRTIETLLSQAFSA